jgi:AraC-like DNA-binding protein
MFTITPFYSRIVMTSALQRGIDLHRLLANTGLTREIIEYGGDIDHQDFVRLLENACRETGDEQLGLLIGRRMNISVLGPVGAAAAVAPTIREGLRAIASFSQLHASFIDIELFAEPGGLRVESSYLAPLGSTGRAHTESEMMLIQHYIESMTGEPLTRARYNLDYARPSYANEYAQWIHGHLEFDCKRPSVLLPIAILDIPSPYFHAEMWNQAQHLLEARLKEFGQQNRQSYSQYVRGLLRSSVPPLPEVSAIAAHLHVSERTLNRRLQDEGVSYREIRMGVLAEWAQRYLSDTSDSVESIAATLGYHDAANFRRAFRSRFGCAPAQYRKQVQNQTNSRGSPACGS